MVDVKNSAGQALPSPTPPTDAELAVWNGLARDEQLRRMRDALSSPACDRLAEASMSDILATARQRVVARRDD
jgi:hypothetical protein